MIDYSTDHYGQSTQRQPMDARQTPTDQRGQVRGHPGFDRQTNSPRKVYNEWFISMYVIYMM